MFSEKIQKFREAGARVGFLKERFKLQEQNFGCVKNQNLVCAGDPCDDNGCKLQRCEKYDITVHCPCSGCPNHAWNTEHYRTYIDLCNAKMDRVVAFVNLFRRSK